METPLVLAWIVVYFVQIAGTLAAAGFLLLVVRRYLCARARFRSKPWCLRCRYPCHDLPVARCPECGRPVASQLALAPLCRWDAWTPLMLAIGLAAAVAAARNPRIDRLYHLLPDQTIARIQAEEGPLAAALLRSSTVGWCVRAGPTWLRSRR
jgi:hypothetical protein